MDNEAQVVGRREEPEEDLSKMGPEESEKKYSIE